MSNVSVSYFYPRLSDTYLLRDEISGDSLDAVGSYSTNSSSQITALSVAITLIMLLAVFVIFLKLFIGKGKTKKLGGFE